MIESVEEENGSGWAAKPFSESARKGSVELARIVSWIGHPLVFVTFSVGIVVMAELPRAAAWPVLLALFLCIILPMFFLLVIGLRTGKWRDADASLPEERKQFYPWAIPIAAAGLMAIWLDRAPAFLIRGGLVTLGLLGAAAILNTRLKISLHTLFASYCAVILFRVHSLYGAIALLLAALVFWSRLALRRHTLAETLAGVVFGIGGGILAAWVPF